MNLNGITSAQATLLRPQESARPRMEHERTAATSAPPAPTRTTASGLLAPRQDALPSEAPAGTDPELWKVLTAEERSFFARIESMGPLTYGRAVPSAPPPSAAPRGGRLDIRI